MSESRIDHSGQPPRFPRRHLLRRRSGPRRAAFCPSNALAARRPSDATWQPSVYLGLEPDGRVIIVAHRSEMGTGIRTALPMIVADELEADWKRVKIEQAIGDKKYGNQNTDGSHPSAISTTPCARPAPPRA